MLSVKNQKIVLKVVTDWARANKVEHYKMVHLFRLLSKAVVNKSFKDTMLVLAAEYDQHILTAIQDREAMMPRKD